MGSYKPYRFIFMLMLSFVVSTIARQTGLLDCNPDKEDLEVVCPPWEEGVPTYLPYPYDCRKFIECSNGVPYVQCCAPSTVWDQGLSVCNHEAFTPCVIVTTTTESDTESSTVGNNITTPTTTTPPTTATMETTMETTTPPMTTISPLTGYLIVAANEPLAIGLYLNTSLADGSKIHANASDFSCSNLAQVWTLERSRTKKPNLNALI